MRKMIILIAGFLASWPSWAVAGDDAEGSTKNLGTLSNNSLTELRAKGYAVTNVIPIFSQLLAFSFPAGFKPAFENTNGGRYTWEAVLNGENVDRWSQMITVTGARGLAANPNATPQSFLGIIVGGFQKACPETFSTKALGTLKISGYDAFLALTACGTAPSDGAPHNEAALLVSIKGASDIYTVQGPSAALHRRSRLILTIRDGRTGSRR